MSGTCKYPGCKSIAAKTWSQLPLCNAHHELIRKEAMDYDVSISGKPVKLQRKHYFKIHRLIMENHKRKVKQ